jgi:mono/diheme cytochrome c family protein
MRARSDYHALAAVRWANLFLWTGLLVWLAAGTLGCSPRAQSTAAPNAAAPAKTAPLAEFHRKIEPILKDHCYDCHGDGESKANVAFDKLKSEDQILHNPDLWLKVLKNTRAGLMPPPKKHPRLPAAEQQTLDNWIEFAAFGVDAHQLDPGRITIRRLNRTEYRNTIRDLMGLDYDTDVAFPADDVGYGFDTIGEVQSLSPMRMEKFLEASQFIVNKSVPVVPRALALQFATGKEFLTADGGKNGDPMNFYEKRTVSRRFTAPVAGDYKVVIYTMVDGTAKPDKQKCTISIKTDDREFFQHEYIWYDCEFYTDEMQLKWDKGDHDISFSIAPVLDLKQTTKMDYKILTVSVYGPLDKKDWSNPPGYSRFFTRDLPPDDAAGRRAYAGEVLERFTTKAFRRPVSKDTVAQLVDIAEKTYTVPGNTFETGVSRAMVAALASPRFLFRVENTEPAKPGQAFPQVDEYALASRLSYFLWSTLPDDELFKLASEGKLRQNLEAQVSRMFADPRARAFVENFSGQWLQTREVLEASINRPVILEREGIKTTDAVTPAQREALKQETEAYFDFVTRSNRSVLELISSDYTFLNETLARYYGVPGVTGPQMRRVTLPPEDPRGGVLTMGSVLAVTSDPARTSPVKRGKWILENILGAPSPPPPPDVPALDETLKKIQDHVPSQREALAIHRQTPLCASCHDRMDPLGLALENFNALGLWRTNELNQPVDASGELSSGESFQDVRGLKKILVSNHRIEFYRTLTEKLLTYALGRGLEYYDVPTVDKIVERLDRENGQFSALLLGVIESAPFQERRNVPHINPAAQATASASPPATLHEAEPN